MPFFYPMPFYIIEPPKSPGGGGGEQVVLQLRRTAFQDIYTQ